MNNRIKELYHEATTWCEQNAQGTPVAWEWEEKFAELILREYSYDIMDVTNMPSEVNFVAKKWGIEL